MTDENPLAKSHQLLWEGLPEPKKGPRPNFTLDQIVTTSVAIADAEGIEALTMRRLAKEIGAGTMSLYRYVPSKDELLHLMLDYVSAPPADGYGTTWRETLLAAAREGRKLMLTHPWLLHINMTRPVIGPNSMAQMEAIMAGLNDLPFSDQEKIMMISLLDSFVLGSVRQEVLYENAAAESDMSDEEFWGYQMPALAKAMQSGAYPTMASLESDAFDAGWEETFELGLQLALDGLAQQVAQRRSSDEKPTASKKLFAEAYGEDATVEH